MTLVDMSSEQRQDVSTAAMRAYPCIVGVWQLTEQDASLLIGVSAQTFRLWQANPEIASPDRAQLERLSLILGIYKALQILLPRSDTADSWLRRPNHHTLFSGQVPLEHLRSGLVSDLYAVRQYLEARLGGDYT